MSIKELEFMSTNIALEIAELCKEELEKRQMEIFKDIIGYEGIYQISNLWNVKSLKFWNGRILKTVLNWAWYLHIMLSNKWDKKTLLIHRLIAQVFILNPENKSQINHINWIKTDNRIENLEWTTHRENSQHANDSWLCDNNHFKTNHPCRWKYGKEHPTQKYKHIN